MDMRSSVFIDAAKAHSTVVFFQCLQTRFTLAVNKASGEVIGASSLDISEAVLNKVFCAVVEWRKTQPFDPIEGTIGRMWYTLNRLTG